MFWCDPRPLRRRPALVLHFFLTSIVFPRFTRFRAQRSSLFPSLAYQHARRPSHSRSDHRRGLARTPNTDRFDPSARPRSNRLADPRRSATTYPTLTTYPTTTPTTAISRIRTPDPICTVETRMRAHLPLIYAHRWSLVHLRTTLASTRVANSNRQLGSAAM